MKQKKHKRLTASRLARKDIKAAKEKWNWILKCIFFPIIFGGKPTKTGRDLESWQNFHYSPQITLTLPRWWPSHDHWFNGIYINSSWFHLNRDTEHKIIQLSHSCKYLISCLSFCLFKNHYQSWAHSRKHIYLFYPGKKNLVLMHFIYLVLQMTLTLESPCDQNSLKEGNFATT